MCLNEDGYRAIAAPRCFGSLLQRSNDSFSPAIPPSDKGLNTLRLPHVKSPYFTYTPGQLWPGFFAPGSMQIDDEPGDRLSRSIRALKPYIVLSYNHRIRPIQLRNLP